MFNGVISRCARRRRPRGGLLYVPLGAADDDDLEAMALQRLFNAELEAGRHGSN